MTVTATLDLKHPDKAGTRGTHMAYAVERVENMKREY